MSLPAMLAVIFVITGAFFYINHRYIRLPMTVGVMTLALIASVIFMVMKALGLDASVFGVSFSDLAKKFLGNLNFSEVVIKGMLAFLLFAGSLHVSFKYLEKQKGVISFLATISVFLSTAIFGCLFYGASYLILPTPLPIIICFLMGAVVSPTDPIAVLAMLKKAKTPPLLQAKIAGESLFNDGVGIAVVLFLLGLLGTDPGVAAQTGKFIMFEHSLASFCWQVGGAIIYGFALGGLYYKLVAPINEYKVEVFLSLAVVYGGYILADYFDVSGPISIVVMGLFCGNVVRHKALSKHTTMHLENSWELIDEFLNAILFTLLGLEMLTLDFTPAHFAIGGVSILIGLTARYISVWIPMHTIPHVKHHLSTDNIVGILTWGGLRGALSIALVLTLPDNSYKPLLIFCTYSIVCFSILVQALTMQKFILKA